MNKSLFDIEQSMYNLLNYGVDDETGEVVETEEDFYKLYDSIQLDLNTKIDNTNCLGKILDGEIEVIDKEIKRLQAEKKSRERKREWLASRVDNFVRRQFTNEEGVLDTEALHNYKLSLPHSKISYRKSESVNVFDLDILPKKYIKKKVELSPDKIELKKLLKEGKSIKGCNLETKYNMNVK